MSELERAGLSALAPAFAADPRPTVDPPYPGRLLRLGSSGPEVALVQRRLEGIRTGRYPELAPLSPDGVFGQRTRTAVQQYQSLAGLAADGIVGRDSWASIVTTYNTLYPDGDGRWPGGTLHPGSRGPEVVRMQQKLNYLANLYTAINRQAVDGAYGPKMEAAVRRFQAQFGLEADGAVGRATWERITAVQANAERGEPDGVLPRYPGRPLRRGDRGDGVRFLQSYLNEVLHAEDPGVAQVRVDGSFGPATEALVRGFQRHFRLAEDGAAGRDTWGVAVAEFNRLVMRGRG